MGKEELTEEHKEEKEVQLLTTKELKRQKLKIRQAIQAVGVSRKASLNIFKREERTIFH